jgi:hypothetical protein
MTTYTYDDNNQIIVGPPELDKYPYYRDQVLVRSFEEFVLLNSPVDSNWEDVTSPDWWTTVKTDPGQTDPLVWMGTYWKCPATYNTNTWIRVLGNWTRYRIPLAFRFTFSTVREDFKITYNTTAETVITWYTCSPPELVLRTDFYNGLGYAPLDYFIFSFTSSSDLTLKIYKIECLFTEMPRSKFTEPVVCPAFTQGVYPINSSGFQSLPNNHIGFFADPNTFSPAQLRYYYFDGTVWSYDVFPYLRANESPWLLHFLNDDKPSFCATRRVTGETLYSIRFYRKVDGIWSEEIVATGVSSNTFLGCALKDSLGKFYILYRQNSSPYNLTLYTRSLSGVWSSEIIYIGSISRVNGFIDQNNKLHFALFLSGGSVIYLTNVTGSFVNENLGVLNSGGESYISFCLAGNVPYIFYAKTTETYIYLKRKVSGSWSTIKTAINRHSAMGLDAYYYSGKFYLYFHYQSGYYGNITYVPGEFILDENTLSLLSDKVAKISDKSNFVQQGDWIKDFPDFINYSYVGSNTVVKKIRREIDA